MVGVGKGGGGDFFSWGRKVGFRVVCFNGIIFTYCALASCCLLGFDRCLIALRTDQAICDILLTVYHLPATQLGHDNATAKW